MKLKEKGNSILANIEESSIDGLILFLFLSGFSLKNFGKKILRSRQTRILNYELLIGFSFLIVFFIHTQFEGWWTGGNRFYLFLFSILLTNILGNKYEPV